MCMPPSSRALGARTRSGNRQLRIPTYCVHVILSGFGRKDLIYELMSGTLYIIGYVPDGLNETIFTLDVPAGAFCQCVWPRFHN